ncbi:MAG: hypothetical protein ACI8WB_000002 [Phenylobacterium sp.]|jgi:hypothetical protein
MKKLLLALVLSLIALPGIYLVSNAQGISESIFHPLDDDEQTPAITLASELTLELAPKQISYRFLIETQMQLPPQKQRNNSTFSGFISLKKHANGTLWYGQILDARLKQNNHQQQWSQPIYFITDHNNFVFTDIDFLALPQGHPGHAILYVLQQLSYQTHSPLLIHQAMVSTKYRYQQTDRQVSRIALEKQFNRPEFEHQLKDAKEHWQLNLLDNNWPAQLRFVHHHDYQNQHAEAAATSIVQVSQKVTLDVHQLNPQWPLDKFSANANALLAVNHPVAATDTLDITDAASLNAALQQLAQSSDKQLAKIIGQYLLAHYSDSDIVNLINGQNPQSTLASLIIYAIQKVANFDAEVMLGQLFDHPQLTDINKQRVVMSMGRFENASAQTLNNLTNITDHDSATLANTALLSIGSLAKFSQSQQAAVEDFLASKLTQASHKAVTITAIKNSGSKTFNPQVEQMLGHHQAAVNVAAIKLLAKDHSYQNRLVEFVVNSGQLKSITALRTSLSNQGLTLTNGQKSLIEIALQQASHPVIKQQLMNLLQLDQQSW